MKPIEIDLTGLSGQFGLTGAQVDSLTEICVKEVTSAIYFHWEALAKRELHSTLDEYLRNLNVIDKGRFARQIVLTGFLPVMIEQGASAFDMKEGFRNSKHVRYTIPVYDKKGNMIYQGGDWYLTIPFRHGTPGIVGQAGFANEMPQEIYDIMVRRPTGQPLRANAIPSPYDVPLSRAAIQDEKGATLYAEYQHKSSIYDGLTKHTQMYNTKTQNIYGTFRRAGANSDPLAWIHKGIKAYNLAQKAREEVDVDTIVENEVYKFLDSNNLTVQQS